MIIKASVDEAASAGAADRMLPRCFSAVNLCRPHPDGSRTASAEKP
jgi:hypothetical protein